MTSCKYENLKNCPSCHIPKATWTALWIHHIKTGWSKNVLSFAFFSRVEHTRQWELSTTNWYESQFKVFLDYCHTYEKRQMKKEFCLSTMQNALRDARRECAPNLARCSKENKKDKFSRVPSQHQVTKRLQQVIEVLDRDLEEKNLTTTTLKALNFFLLQCRLNVRPGPILNVTWECFDSHLKAGHVNETSHGDHKTGKF